MNSKYFTHLKSVYVKDTLPMKQHMQWIVNISQKKPTTKATILNLKRKIISTTR